MLFSSLKRKKAKAAAFAYSTNDPGALPASIVNHNGLRKTVVDGSTIRIDYPVDDSQTKQGQGEDVTESALDRLAAGRNQARPDIDGAQRNHSHPQGSSSQRN